ncbi:hypothetical protein D3C80_1953560 [compost metagenome]
MLALGIVQLPLVTGADGSGDLFGSEGPTSVLAAVHAFDRQACFIEVEVEGVQAIDQ